MGGEIDTRTYKNMDRKAIEKKWAEQVADSIDASGSSYSGEIGMLGPKIATWYDKKFADKNDAEQFIADEHLKKHSKWGPAIAVSFLLPSAPTPEEVGRVKVAESRAAKLSNDLDALRSTVAKSIKNAGPQFVRCPVCESNLNADKLQSAYCPLCPPQQAYMGGVRTLTGGGFLGTEEQGIALTAASVTAVEADQSARDLRKPKPSTEIGWLVGGWCSS